MITYKTIKEMALTKSELPFTPQKEVPYNELLPYHDRLAEDSTQSLSEIKYNLGRAVMFKELTPGVLVWCNRLTV